MMTHLPARRNRVVVERGLRVPMRDGVVLLADHYVPVLAGERATVLIRTPYGRGVEFGLFMAEPYAARGYHVLVESTRGSFGSGGVFRPGEDEAFDGSDTVAWLREQPWFDGRLATLGPSYLGFVQWALAMDPPPELKAMVVQIAPHDLPDAVIGRGPFELYNLRLWTDILSHQESVGPLRGVWRLATAERRLARTMRRLPLSRTGKGLGAQLEALYGEWASANKVDDPQWESVRATAALARVDVPVLLIGGFQDYFEEQTLQQYEALRRRGVDVALTIGPWSHFNLSQRVALNESLEWLDRYVGGSETGSRTARVKVWVGGTEEWREYPEWPPAAGAAGEGVEGRVLYLKGGGRLAAEPPAPSGEDPDVVAATSFRYDPAHPTPSVGGRILSPAGGSRDNTKLEARPDVLTFTSDVLDAPVEVIGVPAVELQVTSDNRHADLFVRLCDVDTKGRSRNVTDQILRLPAGGHDANVVRAVRIDLAATAWSFRAGHRIRLQVSGGAFPRYARNLGTGEPLATAKRMVPTTHLVWHSPALPSKLILPG